MKTIALVFTGVFFAARALLWAEDGGAGSGFRPLPLVPLVLGAFSGEARWQPDWPAGIPPDAFSVKPQNTARSRLPALISLQTADASLSLRRRPDGRLTAFPVAAAGVLRQVSAAWENGRLKTLTLAWQPPAAPVPAAGTPAVTATGTAAGTPAVTAAGEAAPVTAVQPPAETVRPPAETVQPPAETVQPQTETVRPPAETVQPQTETVRPVEIETLAYDTDGLPAMLRIKSDEAWYFVTIDWRSSAVIETWFAYTEAAAGEAAGTPAEAAAGEAAGTSAVTAAGEAAGTPAVTAAGDAVLSAVFQVSLRAAVNPDAPNRIHEITRLYPQEALLERRDYDSMDNVTAVSLPEGVFTALYSGTGPRYHNGVYLRQDGNGLEAARSNGDTYYDYAYRFDRYGNWTERREIMMNQAGNLAIPGAVRAVSRIIEY